MTARPGGARRTGWGWAVALAVALVLGLVLFLAFSIPTSNALQVGVGGETGRFPIVELELAGSAERATHVFGRFLGSDPGPAAVDEVMEGLTASLWWDMGFIAGYAIGLFALLRLLRTQFQMQRTRLLAVVLAWGVLAAGALDVVENIGLWGLLRKHAFDPAGVVTFVGGDGWAALSAAAAWPKWALLVLAVGYASVGLYFAFVRALAWVGRQVAEWRLTQWLVRNWRRFVRSSRRPAGEVGGGGQGAEGAADHGGGSAANGDATSEDRGYAFGWLPQRLSPPDPASAPAAVLRSLLDSLTPGDRQRAQDHLDAGTPELWFDEHPAKAAAAAEKWGVTEQWVEDVRRAAKSRRSWEPPRQDEGPRVGICSSGGGLRSAAYNLGALQALTDHGVYQRARFHAAVSGGAYIAGAYAVASRCSDPPPTRDHPPFAPGSPEERHLRNNSKYLAPDLVEGAGALGRAVLGVAFNLLLIGLLLFAVGRPWGWVMSADYLYPSLREDDVGGLAAAAGTLASRARDAAAAADRREGGAGPIVPMSEAVAELDAEARGFDCAVDDTRTECLAGLSPASSQIRSEVEALRVRAQDLEDRLSSAASDAEVVPLLLSLAADAESLASAARGLAEPEVPYDGGWWGIVGAGVLVVAFGLVSVGFYQAERRRAWLGRATALFTTVAVLLLLTIVVMPFVISRGVSWIVAQTGAQFAAIQTLGGAAIVTGAARTIYARRGSLLARLAGGLVAPVLGLLALVNFASGGAQAGPGEGAAWVAVALGTVVLLGSTADLNSWSLHPIYRNKLASVFAVKRVGGPAGRVAPIGEDEQLLTNIAGTPELIVCAAANVTAVGTVPSGLNARSFTFSAAEVNADGLARIPSDQLQTVMGKKRAARDVGVPSAVAMSGAAIAPGMGKQTLRSLRALLALANVRLGVWLPNPAWIQQLRLDNATAQRKWLERPSWARGKTWFDRRWTDRVRATYLFKEIFGIYRDDDKYLYVTDGGHWENLGLVELLRRGCTEIWCFDAAGEPPDAFATLGQACALAKVELRIEVTGSPDQRMRIPGVLDRDKPLEAPPFVRSPESYETLCFEYPNGTEGKIFYCKAVVTDDAPLDVRMYQEANPVFPAHSTADQLFDHEQFEAYRRLGYFSVIEVVRREGVARPVGPAASPTEDPAPEQPATAPASRPWWATWFAAALRWLWHDVTADADRREDRR